MVEVDRRSRHQSHIWRLGARSSPKQNLKSDAHFHYKERSHALYERAKPSFEQF
ncbi:hypothetical protein [Devosia sp. DBB001]|nr:hypothetical protein [Devosia sp. DBB001]